MPTLSSEPPREGRASSPSPAPVPVDPARVRRILVVRPRFVGDLCLTLPVIDHLRRHAPHAEIDYLAEQPFATLFQGDSRLTRVLAPRRRGAPGDAAALLAHLATGGYDMVLDLFCNPRTAVWTAATRAAVRVGYAGKGWRSAVYNRHPVHEGKSAVAFHLASIAALGWSVDASTLPWLPIGEAERRAVRTRLEGCGPGEPGTRWIAIHPGARWPTRQWAPERYIEVARRALALADDLRVVALGGPGEEALAESIAAAGGSRALAVTGLDLREMAALLSGCAAFVGPDSGPLHVSVAVGTPSVGIFGRNEPERFFPYPASRGHRAVYAGVWCSPCDLDVCSHTSCLRAITAEWVGDALAEVLARPTPGPRAPRVAEVA